MNKTTQNNRRTAQNALH